MPRTPIPEHLIHRPEEVKRNGERFDFLCRLAEEAAFPVVQKALFREFEETTAAGAEILTDEAKDALKALAEEAAILEDLDERKMLGDVQTSLSEALQPPDEEECRQHTRDLTQMLMSAWLESLRSAQSEAMMVSLSDHLLPEPRSNGITWLLEKFGATKPELEQLQEDVGWFAVTREDVATIMTTLRVKLFSEPRLVDLPFDLVMIGTAEEPVLVMKRSLYDRLLLEIKRQSEGRKTVPPIAVGQVAATARSEPATPGFVTSRARTAVNSLSEPLPAFRYGCFAKLHSVKASNIEKRVERALSAIS